MYAFIAAGAVALAVPLLRAGRAGAGSVLRAAAVPFLAFVLGLGVVVRAVQDGGLGRLVATLVPDSTGLLALLAIAGVAAVLGSQRALRGERATPVACLCGAATPRCRVRAGVAGLARCARSGS